jgi:hypothetical protein
LNFFYSYGLILAMMIVTCLVSVLSAQVPQNALDAYASVLKTRVSKGRIDYQALAKKDLGKLDLYIKSVGTAKLPAGKRARIGFYVDAYNAFVMKSVIASRFPKSVLKVEGFFDNRKFELAGQTVSLNQLEKKILNPLAKDPRTHMVLVCGAIGCPVIENKPYFGSNLDRRFAAASRRYLQSSSGARASKGRLQLSQIFKWYEADFGGPEGRLAFAKAHLSPAQIKILGDSSRIDFFEYNWELNQQ